jgi:hypothetical protein
VAHEENPFDGRMDVIISLPLASWEGRGFDECVLSRRVRCSNGEVPAGAGGADDQDGEPDPAKVLPSPYREAGSLEVFVNRLDG